MIAAPVKSWLVFVRDVGAEHTALVQRHGFVPTKQRRVFWGRFGSLEAAQEAIAPLKAAGLHGVIQNKWYNPPPYAPRRDGVAAAAPFRRQGRARHVC